MNTREIIIRMLDDGQNGYIVFWPEAQGQADGEVKTVPCQYAMSDIEDLTDFLSERLHEEL